MAAIVEVPSERLYEKAGSADEIRLEVQKALAARAIGASSGLFYVPRVVAADPEAGRLSFEHLSGLITLCELTGRGDARVMTALDLLGRGLAAVHDRLHLPPEMAVPILAGWEEADDDLVFIHGDLTMNNVCWDGDADRMVVLDWCTARSIGAAITLASRYLDLAWFCASIFGEPPWLRRPFYPAGAMCDRFLSSYANACSAYSAERFLRYDSDRIVAVAMRRSAASRRTRLADAARRIRWNRWLRSSPVLRPTPRRCRP
jgi:hypothetical protein